MNSMPGYFFLLNWGYFVILVIAKPLLGYGHPINLLHVLSWIWAASTMRVPSKRNPSDLAEGEVNLSDGVVPGEAVVVEDVQVQHPRLQLVDREACMGRNV